MKDILLKKPGFNFLFSLHLVDKVNSMAVIYLAFSSAFDLLSHNMGISCITILIRCTFNGFKPD